MFFNAAAHCSRAVLRQMKIGDLLEEVITVEHVGFRSKCDGYGFYRIFRRQRFELKSTRKIILETAVDRIHPTGEPQNHGKEN